MTAPVIQLSEVCSFRHGGTPSKSNPAYWNGDIPWISPKDMKSSVLTGAQDFISPEAVNGSATSLVPKGAILTVVRSGILAHTVPFAVAGRPLTFNQDIKAIQVTDDRLTNDYVFWFLRSKEPEILSRGVKKGATVHSLQSGFLEKLLIPILSKAEQVRIVDLLSRAENIVRMRREAEQKAKEIIPTLFLDMFGDPATNPKGWIVRPIGDVIRSAQYGTSTKARSDGGGVPMIRMGNVDFAGRMTLDDLKYVELPPQDQPKYKLIVGDILFNRTNSKDLVGKTGIWRDDREAVAASYFIRVRADESQIAPDYLWAFMNSRHMKMVLFGTARGAIGQSNINAEELRGLRLPLPPLELQRRFALNVVQALGLEKQQSLATKQSDQAFQSLLARMFGHAACR
jgi:type I restriction enzyme, S subunit